MTSCEHGTPFFPFYHRHLVVYFEISLNYVEEVLLGRKEKLEKIGKNNKITGKDLYLYHKDLFERVFNMYEKVITGFRLEKNLKKGEPLPILPAHYWNPTDYKKIIEIPAELLPR